MRHIKNKNFATTYAILFYICLELCYNVIEYLKGTKI